MTPRTFDEHVVVLSAFAQCVASLTVSDWARVRARCTPLSGSSPAALFSRTQLAAKPYAAHLPQTTDVLLIRAITGLTQGVLTSIGLAKEVAFAVAPSLNEPSRPRRASTGKELVDRYIDAMHTIASTVQAVAPYQVGVATAVDAAAQAVLRRDWLTDAQFHEIYQWIEPEIPLATFDPPRRSGALA